MNRTFIVTTDGEAKEVTLSQIEERMRKYIRIAKAYLVLFEERDGEFDREISGMLSRRYADEATRLAMVVLTHM